ncbi:MAG: hypothetical protein PHW20_09140 [Clostridia bacterium]|nr:hypothetical protein [Clostridia bacterium]
MVAQPGVIAIDIGHYIDSGIGMVSIDDFHEFAAEILPAVLGFYKKVADVYIKTTIFQRTGITAEDLPIIGYIGDGSGQGLPVFGRNRFRPIARPFFAFIFQHLHELGFVYGFIIGSDLQGNLQVPYVDRIGDLEGMARGLLSFGVLGFWGFRVLGFGDPGFPVINSHPKLQASLTWTSGDNAL